MIKYFCFVKNEYLHDGRQVVNCLTDIHDKDFLDRFLLDGSFLVLLDFMCAANSAACFANFSVKINGFKMLCLVVNYPNVCV